MASLVQRMNIRHFLRPKRDSIFSLNPYHFPATIFFHTSNKNNHFLIKNKKRDLNNNNLGMANAALHFSTIARK